MTISRLRRVAAGAAILLLATACGSSNDTADTTPDGAARDGCIENFDESIDYFPDKVEATHSELWSADYHDSYVVLSVPNSEFDDRGDLNYVLVRCGAPEPDLPAELADAPQFEVPVQRTVLNHGNGLGMLAELDAMDTVVGLSGSMVDSTDDPWVADLLDRAAGQTVTDDGDGVVYETTLGLEPDVVYLGGYGSGYTNVSDTVDRGLPAVMISNRIEPSPLGSSEWIKFLSLFHGVEARANERFDEMETRYESVAATVREALDDDYRLGYTCIDPDAGCDFMYAHGADSLNGQIIETLGATNVFTDDNPAPNGMNFDYEQSLDRAADADFLIVYDRLSILSDLLAEDGRLDEFAPLRDGDFLGYIDDAYTRCRFTAYVQVDSLIVDYALGIAPDLFPDEEPTCFGPPV